MDADAQVDTIYSHNIISLWRAGNFLLRSKIFWAVVLTINPLLLPHLSNASMMRADSETEKACRPIVTKEAAPAVIITENIDVLAIEPNKNEFQSKTPPILIHPDKVIPSLLEAALIPCSFIEILSLSAVTDSAKHNSLDIDAEKLQNNKRYYLLRWSHTEQQGFIRLTIALSRIRNDGSIDEANKLVSDLYTLTKGDLFQGIDRIVARSAQTILQDTPNLSRSPLKIAISCFIQMAGKKPTDRGFISPGSTFQKLFLNQLMLKLRPKNLLTIQFIEPDIEGCSSSKSTQNVASSSADGIIQGQFETNKDLLEIQASIALSAQGRRISIPLPIVRNSPKSDLSLLVMANLLGDHILTFLAGAVEKSGTWKISLLEEVYGSSSDWNAVSLRLLFNRSIDLAQDEPDLSTSILYFVFSKLNPEAIALPAEGSPERQERLDLLSSVKLHLGRTLMNQERFQAAIVELEEALNYNRNNADAALDLASAWGYLRNLGKARVYYRQTVSIEPTNRFARKRLAELALKFGDNDEAEDNFRRLLDLDPGSSDVKIGLADALVGQGVTAFESKCDRVFALKKLEEAINFDPASDWLRLNVAELSLLTDQPEKAQNILDVYLVRSSPESFRLRGTALKEARFAGEYMSILARAAMGTESLQELQELQGKAPGLKIPEWNWDFAPLENYIYGHNSFSQDFKFLAIDVSNSVAVRGKQSGDPNKGRPCMTGAKK